jgi:hypothetical protein
MMVFVLTIDIHFLISRVIPSGAGDNGKSADFKTSKDFKRLHKTSKDFKKVQYILKNMTSRLHETL